MADSKSQLNDIVLDRDNSTLGSFKKVLLAIAAFAVLLIIVIVIMSAVNSDEKQGIAPNVLPPEPIQELEDKNTLFKSVEVLSEQATSEEQRLEQIAQEIKKQALVQLEPNSTAQEEETVISDPYEQVEEPAPEPSKIVEKKVEEKKSIPTKSTSSVKTGSWFVQVGSFEKANPNSHLISKIKNQGYTYKLHKTTVNGKSYTKVLIGPFATYQDAQSTKPLIAKKIEAGAFIYQVKP